MLRLKEERVKIETEKDVKVIREFREELRKGRVVEESKIEESMEKLDVKEEFIDPKERLTK